MAETMKDMDRVDDAIAALRLAHDNVRQTLIAAFPIGSTVEAGHGRGHFLGVVRYHHPDGHLLVEHLATQKRHNKFYKQCALISRMKP